MRTLILLVGAALYWGSTHASPSKEAEQERAYTRCMIDRHVQPPDVRREDNLACMAAAGVPLAEADEKDRVGQVWRVCALTAATAVDDGVSPVEQIARAVVSRCADEWRAYVATFDLMPEPKRKMASNVERYALGEGVQAVLLARRANRR